MFPLNPPVSCSLSSLAFQTRPLSNYDIRIFKLALGNKGTLPLHKNFDGPNSCISFPNARPSTQTRYTHYRQGMDVRYVTYTWCILNDVAQITTLKKEWFMELKCTNELHKKPHQGICRIGIFIVNFWNDMHVDSNDHCIDSKNAMLNKLRLVSERHFHCKPKTPVVLPYTRV